MRVLTYLYNFDMNTWEVVYMEVQLQEEGFGTWIKAEGPAALPGNFTIPEDAIAAGERLSVEMGIRFDEVLGPGWHADLSEVEMLALSQIPETS